MVEGRSLAKGGIGSCITTPSGDQVTIAGPVNEPPGRCMDDTASQLSLRPPCGPPTLPFALPLSSGPGRESKSCLLLSL